MFYQKCGKENEDSARYYTCCVETLNRQETPGAEKASAGKFWKRLGIGCAIIVAIATVGLASACSVSKSRQNDRPPDHMKYSRADYHYKKGIFYVTGPDGLSPYIVLVDSSGEMTTSDGTATITIVGKGSPTEVDDVVLYSRVVGVKKSDFKKRTVQGDFIVDDYDLIICEFAPVKYSSLTSIPDGASYFEMRIEFTTPDGCVLAGKSQVFIC
jgi:hypothetical protein